MDEREILRIAAHHDIDEYLTEALTLEFVRDVLKAARRTTPDRDAIRNAAFEQCAQLVDRMAKQKHDRGAYDALVRSIAARIRSLKTTPTAASTEES
ncbi:hypothetical protein [Burkholderia multivorans]|uniref:hypothetical protein n=1 Tax=Burkholderia multivorans TaxID=87883 RepID=UPI001FC8D509|nr:hypothetical protein [Burkholderia multivorans]